MAEPPEPPAAAPGPTEPPPPSSPAPPRSRGVVSRLDRLLAPVGRGATALLERAFDVSALAARTAVRLVPRRTSLGAGPRELFRQLDTVGTRSIGIVALVSFLTGVILVLQSAPQLSDYGQLSLVPGLVAFSMVRELGPVMTAIVITGRVGAAYTAELGTMKVGEEVLALETMALNPVSFLVVPRVVALAIALPLLTAIGDWVGMGAGALICDLQFGIGPRAFFSGALDLVDLADLFQGFLKSLVFAGLIAIVSCYHGLAVEGGAEGVGLATKAAVVTCIVLIILANTLFTAFATLVLEG